MDPIPKLGSVPSYVRFTGQHWRIPKGRVLMVFTGNHERLPSHIRCRNDDDHFDVLYLDLTFAEPATEEEYLTQQVLES